MYSQNSEEQFILNYFGDTKGIFFDGGANDGRTLSNTLALAERGWEGALIEASPSAFSRLEKEHGKNKNLELHEFALGDYDGEIVFHESGELLGTGDIALVSSTRPDELLRWESLNMPFTEMKVPIFSWSSFLERTRFRKFDFFSLDIEGMELSVIPQIDFNELGVKMAIIEFNGKDQHLYDNIMLPQGFRVIHMNAENIIYAK